MAQLLIPQEVVRGIEPLSTVPVAKFQELLTYLRNGFTPTLDVEAEVTGRLAAYDNDPTLSVEQREKVAEAICGVHYLSLAAPSTDELLSEIAASWRVDSKAEQANLETLTSNVRAILDIRELRAAIKGVTLSGDNDKQFVNGRIFTDLRPVFEDDERAPLLASVVMHTLKILVREDGKNRTIYVAADSSDLAQLRDSIDRALQKAKALRGGSAKSLGLLLDRPYDEEDEE